MKTTLKIFFLFLFLTLFAVKPSTSYAYWHGHGHYWVGVNVGWPGPYYYGYPYYYPYDPYYYPDYVTNVTSSYQPIVINGVTYYVNNGVYYLYTQYGYQAVATPAGAAAPLVQAVVTASTPGVAEVSPIATDDSITVNIPDNKGGYTAVVIKRSGTGFIGPQGEFYSEFPKVSQLQVMYGKK